MSMEDLKALTECAECTWDYIDRLRMALAATCKELDEAIKELHEAKSELDKYCKAEQEGLMPPCKRGDVVYCIRHNPCTGYYVKTLTVCTVTIWEPGRFSVFTTKEDELGKTAFLDREEAEMALAQEGGTDEDSGGL